MSSDEFLKTIQEKRLEKDFLRLGIAWGKESNTSAINQGIDLDQASFNNAVATVQAGQKWHHKYTKRSQ